VSEGPVAWAAARLGATVTEVEPLVGGVEAVVSKVTLSDGRTVIVRALESDEARAEGLWTEVAVIPAMQGRGVPMPELLAADVAGDEAGAPTVVLSWIDGVTVHEQLPAVVGTALEPVLRAFAERELEGELRGLRDRLRSVVERTAGEPYAGLADHPDGVALWRAMREIAPPLDTPRTLTHGDLWSGNLLWRGTLLAGVIDFSDAGLAEPAADRATLRVDLALLHGVDAAEHVRPAEHQAFWDTYVALLTVAMLPDWWRAYAPVHDRLGVAEAARRMLDLARRAVERS
jgi:aminoglycoside phosphotransferase (APT) family kinase protein